METTSTKKRYQVTTLVVSSGQYETCAIKIKVKHATKKGLLRRAKQLSREHAIYGDNWTGYVNARVAIADDNDTWGDNQIIGGQWCNPANGWLDLV